MLPGSLPGDRARFFFKAVRAALRFARGRCLLIMYNMDMRESESLHQHGILCWFSSIYPAGFGLWVRHQLLTVLSYDDRGGTAVSGCVLLIRCHDFVSISAVETSMSCSCAHRKFTLLVPRIAPPRETRRYPYFRTFFFDATACLLCMLAMTRDTGRHSIAPRVRAHGALQPLARMHLPFVPLGCWGQDWWYS